MQGTGGGGGGGVMGQHPHVVEDGPSDGGPSQPTAYRFGRCWLLPCLKLQSSVWTNPLAGISLSLNLTSVY